MAGPLNRTHLDIVCHQVSATQDKPHVQSCSHGSCWYVDMWPLWASPWEEGSDRWRGTYLSLLESRLPSKVVMSGKSLLWVSVSLFCYGAAWLLKYIGKVLSITAKERQILTGTTKHIKAVEYKASLYFPKLIHVKGGVLFLDITEWNRKLPWWVT